MITKVKNKAEILAMRESGRMLATVLNNLQPKVIAGITTKDIAAEAKQILRPLGGTPAFLGYQGFPDVICISLNNEVVHGIPSSKKTVKDGDIVSLDFGVSYRGMITDSALTMTVGKSTSEVQKLINFTKRSLEAGIFEVKAGSQVGDISHAIQVVLEKANFGIVSDLVGHGVGHELHEEPNIPNLGTRKTGFELKTGMTIAIEPMATLGGHEVVVGDDGWTIKTKDNTLSAHFEHTVLVTDEGSEVLTSLVE